MLAACLAGGDGTLASHRSAAVLLEFSGFRPGHVEVSSSRNIRRPEVIVHRVKLWLPADVTKVRGIPCTDPARTLIDIAGVVPERPLEIAFHDALTRLTSVPRLEWRLNLKSTSGKPGVGLLKQWIGELGPHGRPSESGFEVLLYRLLVNSGLLRPVRQYPVRVGRRDRRIDLAYPDERLAIEAVGYEAHRGKLRWQSDLGRGNELQSLGWRVLHITWDQFTRDPEGIVALVRKFLGR